MLKQTTKNLILLELKNKIYINIYIIIIIIGNKFQHRTVKVMINNAGMEDNKWRIKQQVYITVITSVIVPVGYTPQLYLNTL